MATTARQLPTRISAELEEVLSQEVGTLTDELMMELITFRAATIGLTFEEFMVAAEENRLPKNETGADLMLWYHTLNYINNRANLR